MGKYLCLSCCLLFAHLSTLNAQQPSQTSDRHRSETDSFFVAKETEVWEALKHKDKAADSRLLADDFVGLYDTGFATKSDHVMQMDDKYSIETYNLQDAKVLRLSPQMALLLYKVTCAGSGEWEQYCSRTEYVSSLWVERGGNWQNLFSQDTAAAVSERETFAQAVAKEKEIQDAQKNNDWGKFADLLSDDLIGIDEGGIHSKKEVLDGVKVADVRFSDYKMEDVRTVPEGNGAIVVYKQTLTGTEHGKPFTWHIYTHSHWERGGDKWLLTMFQDSMASPSTAATSDDESDDAITKAIVANEQRIFETLKRNDIVAFANMLPDDVIDVEDDGIHSKSEWIKEFEEQKKSGLLFTDFNMEDLRLVRYSPSAATLVFRETIKGKQDGKPFVWHINSSSGYVNRGGKWVPVLYQDVMAK